MRTQTTQTNEMANTPAPALSSVVATQGLSYHEMSDIPVREIDLFEQLDQNLAQLEDLQKRLSFMMREIRYMMKL